MLWNKTCQNNARLNIINALVQRSFSSKVQTSVPRVSGREDTGSRSERRIHTAVTVWGTLLVKEWKRVNPFIQTDLSEEEV